MRRRRSWRLAAMWRPKRCADAIELFVLRCSGTDLFHGAHKRRDRWRPRDPPAQREERELSTPADYDRSASQCRLISRSLRAARAKIRRETVGYVTSTEA